VTYAHSNGTNRKYPATTRLARSDARTFHGKISTEELLAAEDVALRDTLPRFEQTGSPIITDREQTKPSFATYPLTGLNILGKG